MPTIITVMSLARRAFLHRSAAVSVALLGWQRLLAEEPPLPPSLGPLLPDPTGVCDLPVGFSYRIISRQGSEMADGLIVPGKPDGMAAFPGSDGRVLLVRNHENMPNDRPGPFGPGNERLGRIALDRLYDAGGGRTPGLGGTTTLVYDPVKNEVEREFLSLAGTWRNCAGGPTPWGSWVTCEETVDRAGVGSKVTADQDHGWCFEVPARAEPGLADPVPLKAMGRFNHEAIAVGVDGDVVYLSEDREDGLLYRLLPTRPGELRAGGRLQALVLRDVPRGDTRNWQQNRAGIAVGASLAATWVDLDQVECPRDDDLRRRGHAAGAALFARGEGMWTGTDGIYLACTSGGPAQCGQLWRYRPGADPRGDGVLELFVESTDPQRLCMADNICTAPAGGLFVCEDRGGAGQRLLHVAHDGTVRPFAACPKAGEWAGICVSPDGATVFANLQAMGLTLAIRGPWHSLRG